MGYLSAMYIKIYKNIQHDHWTKRVELKWVSECEVCTNK